MFHLTVTSTNVNFRYFIFGGQTGQESIRFGGERLGPQGAKYIIGVAGIGYVTITDIGNTGMWQAFNVQLFIEHNLTFLQSRAPATGLFTPQALPIIGSTKAKDKARSPSTETRT